VPAARIVDDLDGQIGLIVCDFAFDTVVNRAVALDWTRDPIDPLISAQALCRGGVPLLTKDMSIRHRVKLAMW